MTIGERLTNERKKLGLTQEDLGAKLNISRQAISKWESDISLPDAANLIKLSSLFSCSIDYILNGTEREEEKKTGTENGATKSFRPRIKEKHSEKTLMGLPLWSIGINSKGFFSLGFKSQGVFSLGFVSRGVCSLGCFSMGGVSIGMASLGLFSLGSFSLGLLSLGAISVGAYSRGRWFSYGDNAKALVAIGKSKVAGDYTAFLPLKKGEGEYLFSVLKENIPFYLKWTLGSIKHLFGI